MKTLSEVRNLGELFEASQLKEIERLAKLKKIENLISSIKIISIITFLVGVIGFFLIGADLTKYLGEIFFRLIVLSLTTLFTLACLNYVFAKGLMLDEIDIQ